MNMHSYHLFKQWTLETMTKAAPWDWTVAPFAKSAEAMASVCAQLPLNAQTVQCSSTHQVMGIYVSTIAKAPEPKTIQCNGVHATSDKPGELFSRSFVRREKKTSVYKKGWQPAMAQHKKRKILRTRNYIML